MPGVLAVHGYGGFFPFRFSLSVPGFTHSVFVLGREGGLCLCLPSLLSTNVDYLSTNADECRLMSTNVVLFMFAPTVCPCSHILA
jgi:hypothetical protein